MSCLVEMTVAPSMSILGLTGNEAASGTGLASVVTNVLVQLLERADIKDIEAAAIKKLISMIF